ncbi:MAG: hypothetical protein JWR53_1848 [Glaciihabitans sp.]|nr:hypothetical protein [Glaciihabitans sp.]
MPVDTDSLRYVQAINAASFTGVSAEPEAQLTVPVHDLFVAIVGNSGTGTLTLIREARLDGIRPDFAATIDGRPCGWIELKAPGHTLDGNRWRGREKHQWELLAELDSLVVTDGIEARLYNTGELVMTAALPTSVDATWDPAPLADLLRAFVSARPATVTRISQLARRLAPLARLLRDRITDGLVEGREVQAVVSAKQAWVANVHEGATNAEFASDLAQVIAYSLAIASLRGDADSNHDAYLSLAEARESLRGPNDMLAAALGPALEVAGLPQALKFEIAAMERLASAVDATRVARSRDARGEPWLWFYEDFLALYDPVARKQAGVYYTPADVVKMQVRFVDEILRERLSIPLSFGDPSVITLDPAAGSGTYPLAVLDQAAIVAAEERGAAGPRQVTASLAQNLIAFEIMPGPYAVSHLRIGQRLAEMEGTLAPLENIRVYLTNTLEDPQQDTQPTLGLFGDIATLAEERSRAAQVKRAQRVTAIIGNPPYARRSAASGGGWVVHPRSGRSLFDDVIDPAREAGVIFSAMRSLYDDYVYFWRWALWKAFEQEQQGAAIVSFITSSSWLRGPVFLGLRRLARMHSDEIWIVDLGGGSRGAIRDENVFSIQTPVAVVTLFRRGATSSEPAAVWYRKVEGSSAEKLDQLQAIRVPSEDPNAWEQLEVERDAPLIPLAGDDAWESMPALTSLFPWQQPGVNFGRSWTVSPSKSVLERRWDALLQRQQADARAEAFVTAPTGRNIFTRVNNLPRLADLLPGAPHREIVSLAYRSFDTQWTFNDPRLALLERPSLWNSRSGSQVFMATMATNPIGTGPSIVASVAVPDFHFFAGRGGKDLMPLFRDSEALHPNVTAGLLDVLSSRLGLAVTPAGLAAYTFGLLSHPGYQQRFAEALGSPGPRVPLTADPELFKEAAELGARIIWLQTNGERYRDTDANRPNRVPNIDGIGWTEPVQTIPADMDAVVFDEANHSLTIGDGVISGVRPRVWNYSVSNFMVVQRWIGSRTAKGVGRATQERWITPLDRIRPVAWEDSWNDDLLRLLRSLTHLVDLEPVQADLLDRVMAQPLIPADALPTPSSEESAAPS